MRKKKGEVGRAEVRCRFQCAYWLDNEMKIMGFKQPLCTCRLNWARRTSWGWWDEWDDTALQTQNSKFESCSSEAEHATSGSRSLPTVLYLYEWAGKKTFFFETWMPELCSSPRSPTFQTGSFNHCTRGPALLKTHHYIIFFVRPRHYKPGMESYCSSSADQLSW